MLPVLITYRNRWALYLLSGICLAACAHKLAPQGHYQSTPVVADGIPDEWTLPLRFSNATYTFQYNITNDSKNIYVCVLSRDEATMLRMLRAGISIYFDPKGDKNEDISLHYPLRKQPDPAGAHDRNGEPLTSQSENAWKEELLRQSDSYGTTGFQGIENGQFGLTDAKSPINVALKLNNHDSLLVYEAIIPIRNVLGTGLGSRSPKKRFSVGVVLNTASGQNVAGTTPHYHNGGGGRGMGIGTTGMRLGGGGGGGRRYNTGDNSQLLKEDANWYQFRLVSQ
ncbi:MAG TPA: hypothetical protein VG052_13360 [Puia sp.]|jgi:hypothetical protein|nr:hypothetical protein [Puia sp.]